MTANQSGLGFVGDNSAVVGIVLVTGCPHATMGSFSLQCPGSSRAPVRQRNRPSAMLPLDFATAACCCRGNTGPADEGRSITVKFGEGIAGVVAQQGMDGTDSDAL